MTIVFLTRVHYKITSSIDISTGAYMKYEIYAVIQQVGFKLNLCHNGSDLTAVPSSQMATEMVSEIPMGWGHFWWLRYWFIK